MYADMVYRRNPDFCTTNLCLSYFFTIKKKYKNLIILVYVLIRKEFKEK